ncbi:MAG: exosortase-associated EpsI family protein [Chlamydiales bacterium]|nr:exosortase-associated EpsI family protein [Chlamydiia bacterium]MCP5507947.1 exosortase-associated EpsI family protein [Chlamydiales bacterium]
MKASARILLWTFFIASVLLGIVWQFYPLPDAKNRIEALPLNGSGFEGKELFLTPFEEKFFAGVNVVKRIYRVGKQMMFITILDGTKNRHVVHDPYYCFRGAGWEILSSEDVKIPHGDATLLHIKRDDEEKQALFWFSDQNGNYTSPMRYWWQSTVRRLTLGASGPEPVLILVQPINGSNINLEDLEIDFPALFHV